MGCPTHCVKLSHCLVQPKHTASNVPCPKYTMWSKPLLTNEVNRSTSFRQETLLRQLSASMIEAVDLAHMRCIGGSFFAFSVFERCRGPPCASDPQNQMHTEENCMRHQQWLYVYALQAQLQYCFPISDAHWLTGQIVPCLSGKGVKGDKQPPPRVWRGVKTWNFHRPRKPASVISLRCTAKR